MSKNTIIPESNDPEQSANRGVLPQAHCSIRLLHLTLKKKWFDMILSGEKKEEYREMKPYWIARLPASDYTHVKFRNGYAKNAPWMIIKLTSISDGYGNPGLGAPKNEHCYILRLGKIVKSNVKLNRP